MLFPTIDFFLFFLVVFPVTWLLNDRNALKKGFLLAASCFFYSFWNVSFLFLLLGCGTYNFIAGLLLDRLESQRQRKLVLILAVAGNLAVLGYFKYANFFISSVANTVSLLGYHLDVAFLEVTLPVAISFFTFHNISYVADVFTRKVGATRSLVDLLLYISFFPHLVAGPIVRARDFMPQLGHRSDPADIKLGRDIALILGGLLKKVVISNYIATDFVDPIFNAPLGYSSFDLWMATYAYAIQIFCDFSAYTDIAIGIANLLGYQFPQNFNQPYRALSIRDFWQRWHMTLSRWLRDYLYIPLGGNRHGPLVTYRNLLITMVLGGLWHGASINFVLWGFIHAVAMMFERATGLDEPPKAWWARALAWLVTFHIVCFAWIFFRASSLDAASEYLSTLLSFTGGATTLTLFVALLMGLGALTQMVPPGWIDAIEAHYDRLAWPFKVAVPVVSILVIAIAWPDEIAPFIYFQF